MSRPRLLILRTVSIEQLGHTLRAVRQRFPEEVVEVLTNPARAEEVRQIQGVDRVLETALPNGFGAPLALPDRYDVVVIPIGNDSGTGYENVFQAARGIQADKFFLARHARRLHPVSRLSLGSRRTFRIVIEGFSTPLATLWAFSWTR